MSDAAQIDNVIENVCVALGFMPSEFSEHETRRAEAAIDAYAAERTAALRAALVESLKLQRHYASLLNMWDGGERMLFDSAEQWMARLESLAAPEAAP